MEAENALHGSRHHPSCLVPSGINDLSGGCCINKVLNGEHRTHELQIKDLAKKVIELTGSTSEMEYVPCEEVYEEEKKELKRSVPDISKINRLIGWQPEVALDEMLQRVIAYERARLDR